MITADSNKKRTIVIVGVVLLLIATVIGSTILSSIINKVQPLPSDEVLAEQAQKEDKQEIINWLNKDNAWLKQDANKIIKYDAEARSGNMIHLEDYNETLLDFVALDQEIKSNAQMYASLHNEAPYMDIIGQMEDVSERFISLGSALPKQYSTQPESDWWTTKDMVNNAIENYNNLESNIQITGGPIH